MSGAETGRPPEPWAGLRWLYAALGAGVALLAVAVFLVLEPGAAGLDPDVFRWVWLGLAVLALLLAGIVRGRLDVDRAPPERARTTALVVWALAEGQALFALVAHLLAGDRMTALLGLLVFAWLFLRHRPSTFRPDRPGPAR